MFGYSPLIVNDAHQSVGSLETAIFNQLRLSRLQTPESFTRKVVQLHHVRTQHTTFASATGPFTRTGCSTRHTGLLTSMPC